MDGLKKLLSADLGGIPLQIFFYWVSTIVVIYLVVGQDRAPTVAIGITVLLMLLATVVAAIAIVCVVFDLDIR